MELSWTNFKQIANNKKLSIQFIDLTTMYKLFLVDGSFSYFCVLLQDGSTDTLDFENNFKSNGNQSIEKRSITSTSAVTSVNASLTSVTLLIINTNRLMSLFFNDSLNICYLKFGTNASSTSYTVQIAAGGYYELPTTPIYTGIITAAWSIGTGKILITELT